MARDDFELRRLEVHLPGHYRAFVDVVRVAARLPSHRAVIEHVLDWYAFDVMRRFDEGEIVAHVTQEQARQAIQRYEEGVADWLRLQAELDAAIKLDPEDPDAIRTWQQSMRVYARERELKDQALHSEELRLAAESS